MPRFEEVTTDNLQAKATNICQSPERLRRGRSAFANDVWYPSGYPLTTVGLAGLALDTLIATPWLNGPSFQLKAIAFNVTVAGGAGSVARVGIYEADEDRVYPSSLVVDSGEVATDVGGFKNIPISVTLKQGGMYFFVSLLGVAAPQLRGAATFMPTMGFAVGLATFADGWQVAQPYGALPAAFPAGAILNTNSFPLVAVLGV